MLEYKIISTVRAPTLEAELNKLAAEGWELVNIARDGVALYAAFKRPLPNG